MLKERPILFTGELVRAILAGDKTVTRRPVKWYCGARGEGRLVKLRGARSCIYLDFDGVLGLSWRPSGDSPTVPFPAERIGEACPYGAAGSRLWVRETFCKTDWGYEYRADSTPEGERLRLEYGYCWRPSIHMPRAASRIDLEVVSVRVERVQDIGEADAKAEGVQPLEHIAAEQSLADGSARTNGTHPHTLAFAVKWDAIYARQPSLSWQANPYVWRIEFRRIKP
jgi:hypothetical protein